MITKFIGRLSMPEKDLNDIDYTLFNNKYVTGMSITNKFKEYKDKEVGLVVNYKHGEKDVIDEQGTLQKINGLWYINEVCLDYVFMALSGEVILFMFDNMEDCEDIIYEMYKMSQF